LLPGSDQDYYLSLHSMYGQPQQKAIQIRALVKNQGLVILLDLGSCHTFLNSRIANKLQLSYTPVPHMTVKVANGASLSCVVEVKNFVWWTQGLTFQVDAKIIDMGAYDLVVGMDWLERFKPLTCDWLERWVSFQYQGKMVRLQGIVSHTNPILDEVSAE
jgi:hypothetical protein